MGSYLQIALGVVLAACFGVLFFIFGFLGADWYYTGHPTLFRVIDTHPALIEYAVRKAFRVSDYGRLQVAFAGGLLGIATVPLLAVVTGKKKTTDSRFMTMLDVQKAGLTKAKGVFIGRAGGQFWNLLQPHTNNRTGSFTLFRKTILGGRKLWVGGDDVGGFVIGPPRSGKGAALIIPNALMWPHSIVILDLRGETYEATAGHRSKFSRVVRFSPADRDGNTEYYNPLQFISLDSAQRDIDLRNMAAALFPSPPGSSDPYWVNDARLLFTGITSYVLETDNFSDDERTLDTVLKILNGEEEPISVFLSKVRDGNAGDVSRFTLSTLAPYAEMSEKQFSGVHSGVRTGMAPFLNERIRKATAKSSFDIRKLKQEKISLYLDVRLEQIGSLGPLFNVLLTQMMNFMSEAIPQPGEHQCLVLLDEFQNLGKLENITQMATLLGGNGVPIWFFVQSLKSVDTVYKEEGRKTLINSARVQIFFGAQDADDLRYVSEQLGEKTETQKDVTRTRNSLFDTIAARSIHEKQMRRPLMRPDEIRTMDKNKVIILPRGQSPILGTRNFYFTDRKLAKVAFSPVLSTQRMRTSSPSAAIVIPLLPQATKTLTPAYNSGGPKGSGSVKRGATFAAKAAHTSPITTSQPNERVISFENVRQEGKQPSIQRAMDLGETLRVLPKPKRPRAAKHVAEPSGVPQQSSLNMDFAEIVAKAKAARVDDGKAMRIADLFFEGKALGKNSLDKAKYEESRAVLERHIIEVASD
jgi:type IV secretion system protein VirD4